MASVSRGRLAVAGVLAAAAPSPVLRADLAVVKVSDVPKEQLKPLPLGSSAPGLLRVGQACLAIGNRECHRAQCTCSGNNDRCMAS